MDSVEKLITPVEAAGLLRVRLSTLYTWAARGQVPAVRVGRCLRFDPHDLARWLNARRRGGSGQNEPPEAA